MYIRIIFYKVAATLSAILLIISSSHKSKIMKTLLKRTAAIIAMQNNVLQTFYSSSSSEDSQEEPKKKRAKKTEFGNPRANKCIMDDYLGPEPTFKDKQFELHFRVSRSRFQRLLEDVARLQDPFYKPNDLTNKKFTTIEAKLLLPLKTLSYSVPSHTFQDYF